MLCGRQLRLLRLHKNITQSTIAERLNITENDNKIYEYHYKPIPDEIYTEWLKLVR